MALNRPGVARTVRAPAVVVYPVLHTPSGHAPARDLDRVVQLDVACAHDLGPRACYPGPLNISHTRILRLENVFSGPSH